MKRILRRLHRRLGLGEEGGRGFNLVILAMTITVMNVMLAAAMPTWTSIIQRDKEAELVFRGLQYAEGIRVFQQRFGRLPVRLEELSEVRPRCVRQQWTNPMTEDGRWGLVMQAAPGGAPNQPGQPNVGGTVRIDTNTEQKVTGPIRGVYSPEGDKAFRSFFGSTTITEWQFTIEQLLPPQVGGDPDPAAAAAVNADDIGRPLPPGLNPVGGGAPAVGGQPGGQPGGAQRPGQPGIGGQSPPGRNAPGGNARGGGRAQPSEAGRGG